MYMMLATLAYVHCTIYLKESVGVMFHDYDTTLIPVAGEKPVTLVIKLPQVDKALLKPLGNGCVNGNRSCEMEICRLNKQKLFQNSLCDDVLFQELLFEIDQITKLHNQLQVMLQNAIAEYDLQSTPYRIIQNSKRSLINIQPLLSMLFGVGSQDDIDKMIRNMHVMKEQLADAENDRQTLFDTVAQLANSSDAHFKNLFHAIKHEENQIFTLSEQMGSMNEDLYSLINDYKNKSSSFKMLHAYEAYHISITDRIMMIEYTIKIMKDWIGAFKTLHQGRIPASLVTPKQLKNAILKLQKWAKTMNMQILPLTDEPFLHIYYNEAHARGFIQDDCLMMTINIPFTKPNMVFDLYKIMTFETPIHNASKSSVQRGHVKLDLDDITHIAISKDGQFYQEFNDPQFDECDPGEGKLCRILRTMRPRTSPSCVFAIFHDHSTYIKQLCSFKVYSRDMSYGIRHIKDNMFLITNIQDTVIKCTNSPHRYIDNSLYTLVELSCNCYIESQNFVTLPDIETCLTKDIKINVSHPISFGLAHHFNFSEYLKHPVTKFSSKNPPQVNLPKIVKFAEHISDLDKIDDEHGMDLKDIADRMSKAKVKHYGDPMPELTSSRLPISAYVAISYFSIWNIFLTIGVGYLVYRNRVLATLALARTTNAFKITTPSPEKVEPYVTDWYQIILIGIAGIMLSLLIYIVFKISTNRKQKETFAFGKVTKLYLKFVGAPKLEPFLIMELPFINELFNFASQPTLTAMSLSFRYCQIVLNMQWKNSLLLQIPEQNQTLKFDMPTIIPINITEYIQLKNLTGNRNNVQMVLITRIDDVYLLQKDNELTQLADDRDDGCSVENGPARE